MFEGCDQKKEETSVEEKARGMKKDLVWRVFPCFPIEAGRRRLSPARCMGESLGPGPGLCIIYERRHILRLNIC